MADLDILVVDDEPLIADYLTRILALRGYSARSFTNPHDALAAIQHGCPRLLITDLRMPGLSGVELAIRIRESCSECKILLFPGEADISDWLRDGRVEGHEVAVLRKPASPAELLRVVSELVDSGKAAESGLPRAVCCPRRQFLHERCYGPSGLIS